jgi:hypothetical protein
MASPLYYEHSYQIGKQIEQEKQPVMVSPEILTGVDTNAQK